MPPSPPRFKFQKRFGQKLSASSPQTIPPKIKSKFNSQKVAQIHETPCILVVLLQICSEGILTKILSHQTPSSELWFGCYTGFSGRRNVKNQPISKHKSIQKSGYSFAIFMKRCGSYFYTKILNHRKFEVIPTINWSTSHTNFSILSTKI